MWAPLNCTIIQCGILIQARGLKYSAGSGPDFFGLERAQNYRLLARALSGFTLFQIFGLGRVRAFNQSYVRARALCVGLFGHFRLRILLNKDWKISNFYKSKIIVHICPQFLGKIFHLILNITNFRTFWYKVDTVKPKFFGRIWVKLGIV